MMEKPQHIEGYAVAQTERAEQVLLDVWSRLGDYHDHLVLVGGLAPRYLVPQNVAGMRDVARYASRSYPSIILILHAL